MSEEGQWANGRLEELPKEDESLTGHRLPEEEAAASGTAQELIAAEADRLGLGTEPSVAEPMDERPEVELTELELVRIIEEMCLSKAQEFHLIGYEHVTGKEIWECVQDGYRKTGLPPLHRIVNDILSLKVTKFMNWMTMNIYKTGKLE